MRTRCKLAWLCRCMSPRSCVFCVFQRVQRYPQINHLCTPTQAQVDPVEWKTELERVGPKLRANQQLTTNEWRAHVDQTVTSKGHIEKVLGDTQGDLHAMNK
jgi:hypothetical protein